MGAYRRVLLKLSGESLGGPAGKGIDENWLAAYAEEVAEAVKNGLQVAIVIGGGNIFRGLQGVGKGFDRVNGDKMGMLATVINSLGLAMAIRSAGVEAEVFTATPMMPVARYYMRDDAVAVMERGGVALIVRKGKSSAARSPRLRIHPIMRMCRLKCRKVGAGQPLKTYSSIEIANAYHYL